MTPPPPGSDASTFSGGGWPKNCTSEEQLSESDSTVGSLALGPARGSWVGSAAHGDGGKGVGGLRAARRLRRFAAPSPPPQSTLLAEASRASSRRRDGDYCGDRSLPADGLELRKWRRRRRRRRGDETGASGA